MQYTEELHTRTTRRVYARRRLSTVRYGRRSRAAVIITTRLPSTRYGVGMYRTIGTRTELAYATEMLCTLRKLTDTRCMHGTRPQSHYPAGHLLLRQRVRARVRWAVRKQDVRQSEASVARVIAFAAQTTTYRRPVSNSRETCYRLSTSFVNNQPPFSNCALPTDLSSLQCQFCCFLWFQHDRCLHVCSLALT